ncbi:MAG: hypothetical protein ABIM74_09555 [candidate division WOR-3 bacterium]
MSVLNLLLFGQTITWERALPGRYALFWAKNSLLVNENRVVLTGIKSLHGTPYVGFCMGVEPNTGQILWEVEFSDIPYSRCGSCAPAQDFFYVFGDYGNPYGLLIAKLDYDGNVSWVRELSGPPDFLYLGGAFSALRDQNNNIVALGLSVSANDTVDRAFLWSLDSEGTQRWKYIYDSPWNLPNQGFSAEIDEDGNAYVVGFLMRGIRKGIHQGTKYPSEPNLFSPETCYSMRPFLLKVNPSGELVWAQDYAYWTNSGQGHFVEYSEGRLYMVARELAGAMYAESRDRYGHLFWYYRYSQEFISLSVCDGLAVDPRGNVYITGRKENPGPELFLTSFDLQGKMRFFNFLAEGSGLVLSVDTMGGIFIGGYLEDSSGKVSFTVIKLDTLGNLKWIFQNNGNFDGYTRDGYCCWLVPDQEGGVFAMGNFGSSDTLIPPIQYIVHLSDTTNEIKENTKSNHSLTIIPAPFGFYITCPSGEARIYDSAGRLVMAREIKGKTLISPLVPGVYFVVAGEERVKVAVR